MTHKSDIDIAYEADMLHIRDIAHKIGLSEEDIDYYGKYKAKIHLDILERPALYKSPKLVLTTAITPTPAGEGKSTTTVGLGQALNRLGKNCTVTLREPSLGPCFGIKGGAAGGGYSQVLPMEDINLHFTGDIHAIGSAHNLLSATIDNHLKQGNDIGINPTGVKWKRVVDINDRSLRNILIGLGGATHGIPREEGYMITVASEVMAILCLSENISDLKERLGNIVIGYDIMDHPIRAHQLRVHGAMAALLKDAIQPNLVQTLENTPAIIHGGPFANIAHGCNSILATRMALNLSEYVITEAGFGADLGAEKFFNIKCRMAGLRPDCVVLVATVRALKMHGGIEKNSLKIENCDAVSKGIENLEKHVENIRKFGLPIVVALNRFPDDTKDEISTVLSACRNMKVNAVLSDVWARGGEGGIDLAEAVIKAIETEENSFAPLYDTALPIKEKIEIISREIYGALGVEFTRHSLDEIEKISSAGYSNLPICMAKTQSSISDNPELLGRPRNFYATVRDVTLSAGAGFIVAHTGDIMTMPGLPKTPAAEGIDIDGKGRISGLF